MGTCPSTSKDQDIFFDAVGPAHSEFSDADLDRRLSNLLADPNQFLESSLNSLVASLRLEVIQLRVEVERLKAAQRQLFSSSSPPLPTASPILISNWPSTTPPPPPSNTANAKKKRRKRKRKNATSFIAPNLPPLSPIRHSTPAPQRRPPPSTPPDPSPAQPPQSSPGLPPPASATGPRHRNSTPALPSPALPSPALLSPALPPPGPSPEPSPDPTYTQVTRPSHRTQTQNNNSTPNIHFYHDSNNKYTTSQEIQTTINNIHEMTSTPRQTYNITLHKTFTLQRTLKDIHTRDLSNSIIIIDTTTNNAKYDQQDQTTSHTTATETLRRIILTLQQKHNISNKNIIILETLPSLKFDIHPYNLAAASICRQLGVRFCPNLAGENHLWEDGIHILHHHRPLLVSSVAAAVVGCDPHQVFRLQRPPNGPNGPWRFPWGSHNRPVPTTRWPPPGSINSHRTAQNDGLRRTQTELSRTIVS